MDAIRITGEVERIIYQNAANGYTVFALEKVWRLPGIGLFIPFMADRFK